MKATRVDGIPKPKGSTKPYYNKHTGKLGVKSDCKGLKGWESLVRLHAKRDLGKWEKGDKPLGVSMDFYFPRPASHFLHCQLRSDAPQYHEQVPDVDKLARAVLDALTGVVFDDDAEVQGVFAEKHWESPECKPGVEIVITP